MTRPVESQPLNLLQRKISYRELIEQHMWPYGIPLAFYSDRHSMFIPVADHRTLRRNYPLTDYERVCRHLEIEKIHAQTPQANANIDWFIDDYNEEFSVQAREITNAHIPFGQNLELKLLVFSVAKYHLAADCWVDYKPNDDLSIISAFKQNIDSGTRHAE